LREIIERYNTPVLFSPNHNIFLSEIEPSAVTHIEHILKRNNVRLDGEVSDIEKLHMACPALPMCGLATTEAERITPEFVQIIDNARKAAGVPDLAPVTRITGCPNGCARTYVAEIGLVGSGKNIY